LNLLRQKPPDEYRLGADDLLGIWIEGVLGEKGMPPPAFVDREEKKPRLGYPILVRKNGTISLPLIQPVKVDGMTLGEAEEAIRKAYTVERKFLQPGQERIMVTLQRPRVFHVLVIRQDSPEAASSDVALVGAQYGGTSVGYGSTGTGARKGTGYSLELPAYENDVLNALARTGGYPGTSAVNEVIIYRGYAESGQGMADLMGALKNCPPGSVPGMSSGTDKKVTRIALRVRTGEPSQLKPEDIILQNGDIVYIPAREADVFYAGGLLPPGEYPLPRDVDLDIIEAIARIRGGLLTNGTNAINLNGALGISGLGIPPPSLVTVIRKAPNGELVNIRVDLQHAYTDPQERILVQAKDLILLQERPQDAVARYFSQVVRFPVTYLITNGPRGFTNTIGTIFP
jgi:hypothetical protein